MIIDRRTGWTGFWAISRLVILIYCGPLAWGQYPPSGQDHSEGNPQPGQRLSVAINWDFEPRTKPGNDPTEYFQYPFDLIEQSSAAMSVDYSPDGEHMAITSGWFKNGGKLIVRNLQQKREVFSIWVGLGMRTVRYSPDGSMIAVACFDTSAKVFDAKTGKQLAILPMVETNGVATVEFSQDGMQLATAGLNSSVILWDTKTWTQRRRFSGHEDRVYCATFSGDSTKVASADRKGVILVWDPATGREIAKLQGHQGGIERVVFTPDSKRLISAGWDGSTRVWHLDSSSETESLRGERGAKIAALAISKDGLWVASGGQMTDLELFNLRTKKRDRFDLGQQSIFEVGFSPDGSEVATACFEGTVRRWNTESHQLIESIRMVASDRNDPKSPVTSTAWSPDGQVIVSGHIDGSIRFRNGHTGQSEGKLEAHEKQVTHLTFSADGSLVASCGCDRIVRIWETDSAKLVSKSSPHADWVLCSAFNRDTQILATGSKNGSIRLLNPKTGKTIKTLDQRESPIRSLDFSPNGRWLASVESDGAVLRWDLKKYEPRRVTKRVPGAMVARFSPDGKLLASAGLRGVVILHETEKWTEHSRLKQSSLVTTLDWSPAGNVLVTGKLDGRVAIRNVKDGALVKSLKHHEGATSAVAFAPSGHAFLAAGVDGRLTRFIAQRRQPGGNESSTGNGANETAGGSTSADDQSP